MTSGTMKLLATTLLALILTQCGTSTRENVPSAPTNLSQVEKVGPYLLRKIPEMSDWGQSAQARLGVVDRGETKVVFEDGTEFVVSQAFDEVDSGFFSGSTDGPGDPADMYGMSWSPDGRYLAFDKAGMFGELVVVVDTHSGDIKTIGGNSPNFYTHHFLTLDVLGVELKDETGDAFWHLESDTFVDAESNALPKELTVGLADDQVVSTASSFGPAPAELLLNYKGEEVSRVPSSASIEVQSRKMVYSIVRRNATNSKAAESVCGEITMFSEVNLGYAPAEALPGPGGEESNYFWVNAGMGIGPLGFIFVSAEPLSDSLCHLSAEEHAIKTEELSDHPSYLYANGSWFAITEDKQLISTASLAGGGELKVRRSRSSGNFLSLELKTSDGGALMFESPGGGIKGLRLNQASLWQQPGSGSTAIELDSSRTTEVIQNRIDEWESIVSATN